MALCWSESHLPTKGPGLDEFEVILKGMVVHRCFDFYIKTASSVNSLMNNDFASSGK